MAESAELFIEKVGSRDVTFGGRDSGSHEVRQIRISRAEWESLGKPEGLIVSARAR